MQNNKINYVVVGAFVTVMLIVFVAAISLLAGTGGSTDKYYTTYANVSGVQFGTQVYFEGYQIGQVESVEPVGEGATIKFRVNMEVEEDWKIPEDSVARPIVSGLLSAITIDISSGKSTTVLKPGAEIKGIEGGNLFATLADISSEFGDLSRNTIRPLIEALNKYVNAFGETTMAHLPELLENLKKVSGSLERSSAMVETDILKPANRDKIDSIIGNFDATAANLATVSSDLNETQALLRKSLESINKVVDSNAGNVDEAARNLRYTLDTVARYVDDIAHNADATARNMAEFSRSLRANPGLLLGGAAPADPPQGTAK